jgi:hypothetical protein
MYFFGFSGNKKITSQECRPLGSSEWWDFGTKNRIYAKVGLSLICSKFRQSRAASEPQFPPHELSSPPPARLADVPLVKSSNGKITISPKGEIIFVLKVGVARIFLEKDKLIK